MQVEKTKGPFRIHPTHLNSPWNPLAPCPGSEGPLLNSTYFYFNLVHLCSSSACHDLSAQAKFENQGHPSEWCISRTV
jgi:hypothetical protein